MSKSIHITRQYSNILVIYYKSEYEIGGFIKVSKEIRWIIPYINLVEGILPQIKKLDSVRTMRTSYVKRDRCYGETNFFVDGTFTIKVRTKFQKIDFYPLSVTILPFSKLDILFTLAHELAHLKHYEHTPEHKLLECQILSVFMYKLKSMGYKSEEEELK